MRTNISYIQEIDKFEQNETKQCKEGYFCKNVKFLYAEDKIQQDQHIST